MKLAPIFATFLGTSSLGLFSLGAVTIAPAAQAGSNNCLVGRVNRFNGHEIYNRCNVAVEAAWCYYADNNCVRYDNTWTIYPGQSYPVSDKAMLFSGCHGENSIARIRGTTLECE
jgi:hypothetical protein